MTDRERLVEILEKAGSMRQYPGTMASILIENGVTFAKDTNVPSWIPVTERLPEKNKRILAFRKCMDCGYVFLAKFYRNDWFDMEWNVYRNCVTHWMPIPEPPKEVE